MTVAADSLAPTALAERRDQRRAIALLGLGCALAVVCVVALGVGAMSIAPGQSLAILADRIGLSLPWTYDDAQAAVLTAIRLPRVLLGVLVGGALALAGAVLQGMFRNPLADPGLIGVSSGAALAVAVVLVVGGTVAPSAIDGLGAAALPCAAFAGGAAATLIVWRLASTRGATSVTTMLLAGVAINALAYAGLGALSYVADDAQLRNLTFWQLGSLNGATWTTLATVAPFVALAAAAAPHLCRNLDAMLLGDREATHLGVDVQREKRIIVAVASLAAGATVAVAGAIGFVGLVMPHVARLALGAHHRAVIPAAALLGAIAIVGADAVARTVVAPAELPIGIVTALFGAPFFLFLLVRNNVRAGGMA